MATSVEEKQARRNRRATKVRKGPKHYGKGGGPHKPKKAYRRTEKYREESQHDAH